MQYGTLRVRSMGSRWFDGAERRRRHSDAERRNEGLRSGGGDQQGVSKYVSRKDFEFMVPRVVIIPCGLTWISKGTG